LGVSSKANGPRDSSSAVVKTVTRQLSGATKRQARACEEVAETWGQGLDVGAEWGEVKSPHTACSANWRTRRARRNEVRFCALEAQCADAYRVLYSTWPVVGLRSALMSSRRGLGDEEGGAALHRQQLSVQVGVLADGMDGQVSQPSPHPTTIHT